MGLGRANGGQRTLIGLDQADSKWERLETGAASNAEFRTETQKLGLIQSAWEVSRLIYNITIDLS